MRTTLDTAHTIMKLKSDYLEILTKIQDTYDITEEDIHELMVVSMSLRIRESWELWNQGYTKGFANAQKRKTH